MKKMKKKREREIKEYIKTRIKKFKDDVTKIAIEKDYPYIEAILQRAITRMKENAKARTADVRENEYTFMNP
jgi:hypothetical protein